MIAFLVLGLAVQAATPTAMPQTETYRYTIERGKHALALELPTELKVTDGKEGGVLTIEVKPRKGSDFVLMVSPLLRDAASPLSDPAQLRAAVERQGFALLPGAVETELTLVELKSRLGAIGYFYRLTDRREKLPMGEWRYMCQGLVSLGPLSMSVTVFQASQDKDQLWRVLGWLQKAQYISLSEQP